MRRILLAAVLLSGVLATAGTASAGTPIPNPTDCHQLNALLHIDNVRDCGSGGS